MKELITGENIKNYISNIQIDDLNGLIGTDWSKAVLTGSTAFCTRRYNSDIDIFIPSDLIIDHDGWTPKTIKKYEGSCDNLERNGLNVFSLNPIGYEAYKRCTAHCMDNYGNKEMFIGFYKKIIDDIILSGQW
jgi:hypothetical protein